MGEVSRPQRAHDHCNAKIVVQILTLGLVRRTKGFAKRGILQGFFSQSGFWFFAA
jgi:hypothetical protein